MQLIPKRIQPFFVATLNRKDGENSLTEGFITCCDDQAFSVSVIGNIRHGMLSGMHLIPEDDVIALEARCKKCGKVIRVFDSRIDGYEHSGADHNSKITSKQVCCKGCRDNVFSVWIKYEYPDIKELNDLEIVMLIVFLLGAGFSLGVQTVHLSRGGIFLLFEKEADQVQIEGTVEEITEIDSLTGAEYFREKNYRDCGHGQSLVLNVETYYLITCGDTKVGDYVYLSVLPRSHLVMEIRNTP